jgi:hypothetical protein
MLGATGGSPAGGFLWRVTDPPGVASPLWATRASVRAKSLYIKCIGNIGTLLPAARLDRI